MGAKCVKRCVRGGGSVLFQSMRVADGDHEAHLLFSGAPVSVSMIGSACHLRDRRANEQNTSEGQETRQLNDCTNADTHRLCGFPQASHDWAELGTFPRATTKCTLSGQRDT